MPTLRLGLSLPLRRPLALSSPLSVGLRNRGYASDLPMADPSPPPARPPVRDPVEPTTFDGKAAPRDIHKRPKLRFGMPQGKGQPWDKDHQARMEQRRYDESMATAFAGPSKPRAVYTRPYRDLPVLKSRIPLYIALATLGLGAWGLFILYATNNERLSSSVMRQVQFQLRNSTEVTAALGDHVRLADNWWGFGEPWISGGINLMQGRIDLRFRVQGTKDAGFVFFTAIRPEQAAPWRIVRYKLIPDNGEPVPLQDKTVRPVTP